MPYPPRIFIEAVGDDAQLAVKAVLLHVQVAITLSALYDDQVVGLLRRLGGSKDRAEDTSIVAIAATTRGGQQVRRPFDAHAPDCAPHLMDNGTASSSLRG